MLTPVFWRKKLQPFTKKSNLTASLQIISTLVPFALLWAGYLYLAQISFWFAVPFIIPISFFILRMFVLMHDCGHSSLFESQRLNKIMGFSLGVLTGMPQFVWSKNHAYHHKTNGDWEKYGGVFNISTTDEYDQLSPKDQRKYWLLRHPAILIPGGFIYVLFNPRFNWILGNLTMLAKIIRPLLTLKITESIETAKKWETKYWKGKKDYLHMTYNNLVLIPIIIMMCMTFGTGAFLLMYVGSVSLAGSLGILTFAVQHNFEDAYATDTAQVNYYRAALEGTSFLILPKILNWFTADIAYHHVHHLSSAIPNYRLKACHEEFEPLFSDVKRVYLSELMSTFKYQLWDPTEQKVVARGRGGDSKKDQKSPQTISLRPQTLQENIPRPQL
jgi:omega-6 fatty acid desaturase (delta-12 desaturase)